jgi:hypothetical protein
MDGRQPRINFAQAFCQVRAVEVWHPAIGHDEIKRQRCGSESVETGLAIGHLHNLAPAVMECTIHERAKLGLVVYHQGAPRHRSLSIGRLDPKLNDVHIRDFLRSLPIRVRAFPSYKKAASLRPQLIERESLLKYGESVRIPVYVN